MKLAFFITRLNMKAFLLVDMREGGEDSRYFGPVSRDEIDGLIIEVLRRNDI